MFLYHRIPKEFRGTKLFPLNQLKKSDPQLHALFAENYRGREDVMKQVVPLLNCLWNDVVFLSPVAPTFINEARRDFGLTTNHGYAFVIDSQALEQDKLLLYRHRPPWLRRQEPEKEEYARFSEVTKEEIEELAQVPECARWSMEKFREKSFFFGYVPHILYLGEIDIANVSILEY